jgi:AhpD family alkylhydroperoxidase
MNDTYYNPADLAKFGQIGEFQPTLAAKFFDYYGEVFKEGALSEREKALIALAVAHTVQCDEAQMMEALHVAAAIRGGASLVHGVQMMNKVKEMTM